jgi:hypothetical protein
MRMILFPPSFPFHIVRGPHTQSEGNFCHLQVLARPVGLSSPHLFGIRYEYERNYTQVNNDFPNSKTTSHWITWIKSFPFYIRYRCL